MSTCFPFGSRSGSEKWWSRQTASHSRGNRVEIFNQKSKWLFLYVCYYARFIWRFCMCAIMLGSFDVSVCVLLCSVHLTFLYVCYYARFIWRFCCRFQIHIDLCHIRNCSTQKGIFVLDEFGEEWVRWTRGTSAIYRCRMPATKQPIDICHTISPSINDKNYPRPSFKMVHLLIASLEQPTDWREGGYSNIFPVLGRSACQGIIFRILCLKQGIQFHIFVS